MNRKLIPSYLLLIASVIMTVLVPISCVHDPIEPLTNGETPGEGPGPGTGENPDEEVICDTNIVYFNQVQDILTANCTEAGCHSTPNPAEGITFKSYEDLMNNDIVRPGSPRNSDLYEVLVEDDRDDRMPLDKPALPADQIALIRKWIEQGAENITCIPTSCDTSNVTYALSIAPIIQNKCIGCHSGSAPFGKWNLSTHSGLMQVVDNGKLIGAVNHENGFQPMPQGGNKLRDCDIRKIELWIEAGAQNN
ncbi:MAG TPA: hypothetical protein VD927_06220 [Chryseosolibacter sp.]|nr:hypothetical protein [Chryseosolibacter sp.]